MRALPARLQLQLDADEASSAVTDANYEKNVRESVLPAELERRCGLQVVRGVDLERARGSLSPWQWDFRAPVLVTLTSPNPSTELGVFEVFPSQAAYIRPPSPSGGTLHLTPTKFGGAPSPPSADYLALFEVTTARKWTARHGAEKDGMLARLEKRLRLSLDRALSEKLLAAGSSILNLVAVVGVVAPAPYSVSVRDLMAKDTAPQLLKAMMGAGRFVFLAAPRVGSP